MTSVKPSQRVTTREETLSPSSHLGKIAAIVATGTAAALGLASSATAANFDNLTHTDELVEVTTQGTGTPNILEKLRDVGVLSLSADVRQSLISGNEKNPIPQVVCYRLAGFQIFCEPF